MSVDCNVRLIYGFELDQNKFQDFIKELKNIFEDFNIYRWMD